MNQVAEALREFITENFLFGLNTSFAADDSLLERGIVDSTGVLELITFVESTYGIAIADDELVPENLDSINGLTRFIAAKKQSEAVQQQESLPA